MPTVANSGMYRHSGSSNSRSPCCQSSAVAPNVPTLSRTPARRSKLWSQRPPSYCLTDGEVRTCNHRRQRKPARRCASLARCRGRSRPGILGRRRSSSDDASRVLSTSSALTAAAQESAKLATKVLQSLTELPRWALPSREKTICRRRARCRAASDQVAAAVHPQGGRERTWGTRRPHPLDGARIIGTDVSFGLGGHLRG